MSSDVNGCFINLKAPTRPHFECYSKHATLLLTGHSSLAEHHESTLSPALKVWGLRPGLFSVFKHQSCKREEKVAAVIPLQVNGEVSLYFNKIGPKKNSSVSSDNCLWQKTVCVASVCYKKKKR